jgi:aminoglycoside phosphotransferase (APT) family kinase protein
LTAAYTPSKLRGMADTALLLPDDIVEWMESATSGRVVATNRVPGGASREAWFVDVERDGETLELFLRYSRSRPPPDSIFHSLQVEAEVFLALQDTDVTVPRTIAVHPTDEAMLAERVSGQTWFSRIRDPDEQVLTAQDFIRNLAALHRLDPRALALPSLGPVKTAREHALDEIANMRRRATRADGSVDGLVRLSLDWLERNVPAYDGPVVFVQGDTGPGNFMYEDGHVTAVVDWELAHFGDPMDDIAWLSLRTVQDTFTYFPDRLREYEELSGHPIDAGRVWYYRLFAELRLMSNSAASVPQPGKAREGQPVARDIGNGLIYNMLHRRLTVEALANVVGIALPDVELPATPPEEPWHGIYDTMLENLQVIVPRIDDPLAGQWTKGVARVVKYLKELDLAGRAFADEERTDLLAVTGAPFETIADGRRTLDEASADGRVTVEDHVAYLWRQVQRDDHLMRTASGALHDRTWPPITDPH